MPRRAAYQLKPCHYTKALDLGTSSLRIYIEMLRTHEKSFRSIHQARTVAAEIIEFVLSNLHRMAEDRPHETKVALRAAEAPLLTKNPRVSETYHTLADVFAAVEKLGFQISDRVDVYTLRTWCSNHHVQPSRSIDNEIPSSEE